MLVTPFDFNKFMSHIKEKMPHGIQQPDSPPRPALEEKMNKGLSMTHVSPIIAGIFNLRNSLFSVKDCTLYQFFGHVPVGVSTSVELHENKPIEVERTSGKVERTILINLDTSNSFLASDLNLNVGGSYSCAHIHLGQTDPVSVHSDIRIDTTNPGIATTNPGIYFPDNITRPVLQLTIDNNLDKSFINTCKIFKQINNNEFITKKDTLYYHGKSTNNYRIFTLNLDGSFDKWVYILDEAGFKAYIESAGYIPPTQNKYYKYQNKYLKYKSKYTDLKKQLSNK